MAGVVMERIDIEEVSGGAIIGYYDPHVLELFSALHAIDEEEAKGRGPYDFLRREVELAAW
jgi:hypothetical protein